MVASSRTMRLQEERSGESKEFQNIRPTGIGKHLEMGGRRQNAMLPQGKVKDSVWGRRGDKFNFGEIEFACETGAVGVSHMSLEGLPCQRNTITSHHCSDSIIMQTVLKARGISKISWGIGVGWGNTACKERQGQSFETQVFKAYGERSELIQATEQKTHRKKKNPEDVAS